MIIDTQSLSTRKLNLQHKLFDFDTIVTFRVQICMVLLTNTAKFMQCLLAIILPRSFKMNHFNLSQGRE